MKKSIAIIGGGPSAMLLASFLDGSKFEITIYERNKTLGRKFLVAGKGGFNLTHSEPISAFINRYTPSSLLQKALLQFDNEDLRNWLSIIGNSTFVGSSGRVFPTKGIKPVEVLNSILNYLKEKEVEIKTEYTWNGWDKDGLLIFNSNEKVRADFTVFAIGGGSWKVTGSDGQWTWCFEDFGVEVLPFKASNCAYKVDWDQVFIEKYEGKPLKNIAISCKGKTQKGEAMITQYGLEGNAIYALSPQIQSQLDLDDKASVFLDLKPIWSEAMIRQKLNGSKFRSIAERLRKTIKLSAVQVALIKANLDKESFTNLSILAARIKYLPLEIIAAAPLNEAISTTGGIPLKELTPNFELKKIPNIFCLGEMVDWNAPTGGYLLQGCFSMGVYLARYLNRITFS